MGLFASRPKRRTLNHSNDRNDFILREHEPDEVAVVSLNAYDEREIRKLKKELKETPQIFVLNNLLFAIMFFENYEKERHKLIHTLSTQMEKTLNPILRKSDIKSEFIAPDIIFDRVNKNCAFCPVHGPLKSKSQPIAPKRLFVINDNIEVIASTDELQYSSIDKPSYKVIVEESKSNGFLKLKNTDSSRANSPKVSTESIQPEPQPGPSLLKPVSTDDFYEYTTITNINTPKPLTVVDYPVKDKLPKSCFTIRRIQKFDIPEQDEDEEPKPINEDDLYENITYINSKGFMDHFQNAIFPNSLAQAFGFDQRDISLAKSIPGTIFCSLSDPVPIEIYPSVAIQWPSKQTFEFRVRKERPIMIYYKNGDRYQWPNDQMIQEIYTMKCVLLPRGNFFKRGQNPDSDIEWEIAFPKAERYLDTRMSHAQIKIFLFYLLIFRTYIEPATKQHGLRVDHIRQHLYWESELNPVEWPELRLGTKLISSIENFYEKLSKNSLPNYFIKSKNCFENIPNHYLKHAQKVFHDILESPMIYFMGALRNLKYNSDNFYPTINFSRLYRILTAPKGLGLVHDELLDDRNYRPPNLRTRVRPKYNEDNKELNWRQKKEQINRQKVLQKRQQQKEEENLKILEQQKRKGSIDSINFEWDCEKEFDIVKIHEILVFFIDHFIEMGRKSRKLSTERQALLYLKQAYYLAKVMEDYPVYARQARDYLAKIAEEEEISQKAASVEIENLPPTTPNRNSIQFNGWDITQQVKGSHVKLNKLNTTFISQNNVRTGGNLKHKPSVLKKTGSELSLTAKKNVEFVD